MEHVTIDTPTLGNRSYVVIDGEHAVVVDPPRDIDRVIDVVDSHDARVHLVLETHRHADYVSGGLELARRYEAPYGVPIGDPLPRFICRPVTEGTRFSVGGLTLRALHTPGHTPHHYAYVLDAADGTSAVFTGGSLLPGAVGRTDLQGEAFTRQLAHDQWRSVRRLLRETAPEAAVLATHGFGSPCSAGSPSSEGTTIAEQSLQHPVAAQPEAEFVNALLASYDPLPAYYARLPELNAAGPAQFDLTPPAVAQPSDLAARLGNGEWIVDLRDRRAYAGCHLAGSLSFGVNGKLAIYLAWLLPPSTPLTLLADGKETLVRALRELSRVGIDRIAGQAVGTPEDWSLGDASRLGTFPVADLTDLALALRSREPIVVDVRSFHERACAAVAGSLHVPLEELAGRIDQLGLRGRGEIWVHCATGYRAAIAASLLDRAGLPVVLVDDAFSGARWSEVSRSAAGAFA